MEDLSFRPVFFHGCHPLSATQKTDLRQATSRLRHCHLMREDFQPIIAWMIIPVDGSVVNGPMVIVFVP